MRSSPKRRRRRSVVVIVIVIIIIIIITHSLISVSSFHFIRLVSFCLLFLMTTLQEKINDLEAEIADYRQEYVNASPEVKKGLLAAITESRQDPQCPPSTITRRR